MTRKAMLILVLSLSACAAPEEPSPAEAVTGASTLRGYQAGEEAGAADLPLRALSLRVLQQTLAACAPGASCPDDALSFGRITRILGYSLDPGNHDVLVYGLADPALPRIQTDDVLIALRSSWLRYAEGNVYEYPGCDIRPNPDLVRRLQEVSGKLFGSADPQETEAVLQSWKQTCELPQEVSVLGIPFDTHFGHVLVTADYDMKRLVDGSDALGLPGLESVMGLELRSAESAVRGRRPLAVKASMNRFWLTPGEQVYEERDGITWIRSCPVRIRTHPIGIAAGGELDDVEGGDAMAEEFARRFSNLYGKVAEQRPVYQELRSLFQVFALTQLLHFRQAPEQVGLDLGYLLDLHSIQPVSVQRRVPGRNAVQRFHHEREVPGGTEIVQFWMPSCGGVEMQIDPSAEEFRRSSSETLDHVGARLAEARPKLLPVAWNVRPGSEASLDELKRTLRLQDINRPGSPLLVTVKDQGSAYQVVGDRFDLAYTGLDMAELMRRFDKRLNEQLENRTVYVELEGFSDKDAEVFTKECQSRLRQSSPEAEVRALRDVEGTLMEKVLVSPGLRLEKVERATQVTEGRFKGLYRAVLTFSAEILGSVYRFTMTVLFADALPVHSFVESLEARFALSGTLDLSALDLVYQTRRELARKHGQAAGGIDVQIEVELEGSQFVELGRVRDGEPV